jgi:zinc transport system substrate-binding protein
MKRKFLALLMALCMVFSVNGFAKEEKVEVVTTIFPMYDWVKNILGEAESKVSLSLLVDSGADLHNFQPTVEDFVKLSKADLFIYLGGPSDSWAEDAVKEAKNKDQRALNLMEALGELAKESEHVEGMEEHDHDHDHEDEAHDDHDLEHEEEGHDEHDHEGEEHEHHHHVDEHIWLSLKNAKVLVKVIAEELAQLLPEDAKTIQANAQSHIEKLDVLDKQYQAVVDGAENKTLLFGDRFPFLYLMDDYGLNYYAAFSGCSAESEASFETIAFLSSKMDEEKLSCIFAIDGSTQQVAKAILGASKDASRPILVLDSMQTVNRDMIDQGVSYLGIMEKNLLVLKQALQ